MRKEKFVECIICGRSFNNYYKVGKLKKETCSIKCYNEARNKYHYEWSKKKIKERVKKKCYASCGKKVKPIIILPYRGKKCQDKLREYSKRRKLKK